MCEDNLYVPEFLNTREKWDECVCNTGTVKKFEQVMNKLLEDEKITALDFYIIMCTLNYNLEQEHKNDSYYVLLQLVEALIHYYQYQNEQSKK